MDINRSRRLPAAVLAIAIGTSGVIVTPTMVGSVPTAVAQEQNSSPVSIDSAQLVHVERGYTLEEYLAAEDFPRSTILLHPGITTFTLNGGQFTPEHLHILRASLPEGADVSVIQDMYSTPEVASTGSTLTFTITIPETVTIGEEEVSWDDPRAAALDVGFIVSDGSTRTWDVQIAVAPEGETNEALGDAAAVGEALSDGIIQGRSATINATLPNDAETNLDWVTIQDGNILVTPGYLVPPGTYDLVITTDTGNYVFPGAITVNAADLAGAFSPTYESINIDSGATETMPVVYEGTAPNPALGQMPTYSLGDGFQTPEGWNIAVNPHNGELTVTSPDDLSEREIIVPVVISYPDRTVDNATIRIVKEHTDAELHDPSWGEEVTVSPDTRATLELVGEIPEGTRVEVSGLDDSWLTGVNKTNHTISISAPEDAENQSTHEMTITVTYPDGTTDTETIRLTVDNPSLADVHTPTYNTQDSVPQRTEATYAPSFEGRAPQVDSWALEGAPSWLSINPDTGVITAVPGNDETPGTTADVQVVTNYIDGSVDVTDVTITVGEPEITDGRELEYDVTMPVRIGDSIHVSPVFIGGEPEGELSYVLDDSPEWITIDPVSGMVTITPVSDTELGSHDFTVTVTYADGSTDTATASVDVDDRYLNERTDFTFRDLSIVRGQSAAMSPAFTPSLPEGTVFTLADGSPEWATVDSSTGRVSVSPTEDSSEGVTTVTVVATYLDGSVDEVEVNVDVLPMNSGEQVSYPVESIDQGETLTLEPFMAHEGDHVFTPGDNVPEWVTVDENTGVVTAAPGYTVAPGAKSLTVNVTYPDGSTGVSRVNFSVNRVDQNVWLSPGYAPVTVQAGKVAESETPTFVGGIPTGNIRYEVSGIDWVTINSDGVVIATPPATTTPGDYDAVVTVIYSDGSRDTADISFTVTSQDYSDIYTPVYSPVRVAQDAEASVDVRFTGETPDEVTFSEGVSFPGFATLNPENGTVTLAPSFNDVPGSHRIPVTVTYADGTFETAVVSVEVTRGADSDRLDFSYPALEVAQATNNTSTPRVVDVAAGGVAADTSGITFRTVGEVPEWITINASTGVLSVNPLVDTRLGDYMVTVEAIYADGTRENTNAGIRVSGTTDATRYEITFPPTTVEQGDTRQGETPTRTTGAPVPEGVTFTADNAPSWMTFNADGSYRVSPGYEVPSGSHPVTVTVNYADGSSEQTTLSIRVTTADIAKDFDNPRYQPSRVTQGNSIVSAAPQDDNRNLPEGTSYRLGYGSPNWVELDSSTGVITASPGFDIDAGRFDVPVQISYRDGSSVITSWSVTVNQGRAADGYSPSYSSGIDVVQGSQVTIPAPRHNGQKLPEGTTFTEGGDNPEWVSVGESGTVSALPGMNVEPGSYQATTVVTYRDGTIDEVPVTIRVVAAPEKPEEPVVTPGRGQYHDYTNQDDRTPAQWETIDGGTTGPDGNPINPDGTPVSGDNDWVGPDVNTGGSVESAGFFSWIKGLFR